MVRREHALNNQSLRYAMNIIRNHTPFAQAHVLAIANMHTFSISHVFDLLMLCTHARNMYSSIVENEPRRFFKPTALWLAILALEYYNMVFY